jgi:hypothetical protein
VNHHITRIRLASVGPEPARFDPLDLDLRNPEGTGPADSVLYLPNTGGKTVLLRLLFSVLHPPVVDRIGTEETSSRRSKNIVGYVLDRDTAHIVLEWRRAEKGQFADTECLLTGLVAEWRGGVPTGNPGDLVRLWYTVKGPIDQVGIDHLVFDAPGSNDDEPIRRRLPLRKFREQLEELGRGRGGPAVSTTDTQRVWVEHLDKLGLDPTLFRYQGQMNHNEAGASAIARFTSDLAFIDFFVKAVMDPSELDILNQQFEEVAEKVRRYPEYELWLRFQRASLAEVEILAAAVRRETDARTAAEAARLEGLNLLASFAAGATVARERERTEEQRAIERDAEARRMDTQADRARDDMRAYRRIEAEMKRDDAETRYNQVAREHDLAGRDARAWELVEWLVLFQQAEAKVATLEVQYTVEQQRLRPKQERRDSAGVALRERYLANAVVAEADATEETTRAASLQAQAKQVHKEQQDARDEALAAEHSATRLTEQVAGVRGLRERLVAQRHLGATEATGGALDRAIQRGIDTAAAIARLDRDLDALETERERVEEENRAIATRQLTTQQQHVTIADEVVRAEAERTSLATDPLVVEVAETQPVDLEILGTAIADRLLRQEVQATVDLIALELHAAADRRAVAALQETHLLPPPADIEATLKCLHAAGIDSAMAGTAYLAEAVKADDRYPMAAQCPEVAGGIVLTDPADLPRAQAALAAMPSRPAMLITVSDAARLFKSAAGTRPGHAFLVTPTEAVWNLEAGDAERKTLDVRLGTYDAQRGKITERGQRARQLADSLGRHLTAYPKGRLAAQVAHRDGLAAELRDLRETSEALADRRQEIVLALRSRREERPRLDRVVREAEIQQHVLEDLLAKETETEGFDIKIEKERLEAAEWHRQSQDLERDYGRLQEERDGATHRAIEKHVAAQRNREDAKGIRLAKIVPEPPIAKARELLADGKPLAELQTWFIRLDADLVSEMSASAVAADRQNAIEDRDQKQAQVQRFPAEIRDRGAVLLTLPEASTEAGRLLAAEQARTAQKAAEETLQQAHTAFEQAKQGIEDIDEEIRRSDHQVRLTQERMPRDRHHVALLIAESRQAADAAQAAASRAEREREEAQTGMREAKYLADTLGNYVATLKMTLGFEAPPAMPSVAPFVGNELAVQTQGLAMTKRVQDAHTALQRAHEAWLECDKAVRAVVAQYGELAGKYPLHMRLITTSLEMLARDAEPLIAEMKTSITVLGDEIATRTEDIKLAAKSLARTVNKTLTLLRAAERRSRMPASLRDWAHEEFLAIRFEKPHGDELETRLLPFVTEVLSRPTDRPTGSELLLQALERAIGKFTVTILKPNEAFDPIRVPVAEVSSPTFSNGQRSTVATALMLMLSELRHQSRSTTRGASVGTLLLDNPFGNANAGFLIEVQRTIAAAAGIQLVYTTGIKDYNALRHFPNVIGLSNDAVRRTMRRYVRANPDLLQTIVPQDATPGGRVMAARVVARPRPDGQA